MILLLPLFMFSAGFFWQSSYDICKEAKFELESCELQKKANEIGKWTK